LEGPKINFDQTTYQLKSKAVFLNDVTYKLYYLVLREGTGTAPSNVDGVLASYRGTFRANN
jgi:FKBP-type peptidyl-prolyl cis-trans isomerase